MGYNALGNGNVSSNTAIGHGVLVSSTGNNNTGVGADCLAANTSGAGNTAVGTDAGKNITTGSENVQIGFNCRYVTTGSYNTVIGAYAGVSGGDATNQIVLGRNITGGGNNTFKVGSGGNAGTYSINGSATSWSASSDERLKENITNSTIGLNFINDLRPVTYTWKAEKDVPNNMSYYKEGSTDPCRGFGTTNYGFVAQEVKAVIDSHSLADGQNLHRVDDDGTQELAPAELVPMLVKAIQELSAEVETLKSQLGK